MREAYYMYYTHGMGHRTVQTLRREAEPLLTPGGRRILIRCEAAVLVLTAALTLAAVWLDRAVAGEGAMSAGMLAVLIFITVRGGRRARVPALLPPMPPLLRAASASPCRHPGAVRVASALDRDVTLHVWCPDCDKDGRRLLPANWRCPTCACAPGDLPGQGHLYNCPERKEPAP